MSIQSTRTISREEAIGRIQRIKCYAYLKEYMLIDELSYEDNFNIQKFVDNCETEDVKHINKWTNDMLADKMDEPFFRYSMFDNYEVED